MAELVDAPASGAGTRKGVEVRVLFWAPNFFGFNYTLRVLWPTDMLVFVVTSRETTMTIRLHKHDLPDDYDAGDSVAIDTETMGLNPHRDRLCLVQISTGDGNADLVQISQDQEAAPNLTRVLNDRNILKLFHFARFDVAILLYRFGALTSPIYCTKIASRLVRTYTDRHGLKEICRELIGVDISKQQQSSDWASDELSEAQLNYAASDVLYLHQLKTILTARLFRENRFDMAQACFDFLGTRADLDLAGWDQVDIFSHTMRKPS